ncbi:hypothetical protein SLEP1_g5859 [Rubroshorea leprosula]|uniref:Reverse transcriptase Ty1/copia-type domain-containing protein n=1 Tax=Rubroshorea leprosula TaxID=152421 RepID=A0AAV5I2Y0_9ROSI|nr:hypothetical protein SLEP1_g5859 [Rubroshorea leprosula]
MALRFFIFCCGIDHTLVPPTSTGTVSSRFYKWDPPLPGRRLLEAVGPQDPRIGQLLGTGHKVGRLFELNYLHILDNKMDTPSFSNDRFIQTLLCAVELESLQIPYQQIFQAYATTNISLFHLWHSQLGHTSVGTSNELYNVSPHASTSSVEDDLLAGNTLDNFEPSSTSLSVSPVDSTNELIVPSSSHLARQQAMQDELQALENTRTWDLIDLLVKKSLIGCKWVCKIKTRSDGSVECYKARLVAKGFIQEYGIDYEETFAPVARLTSMRSLLAIAAMRRWKLFQMDVKNAFLNGDLEEEVYMKPPPGLNHPPNKFGFTSNPHDTALFIRKTARGMVLLLLYVDDMIITGDDVTSVKELKQSLNQKFEMKDLGVLSYFLGLEVTSSDDGYLLSQVKYASDLVSKAELNDGKSVSTPLEPNVKLTPMDGSPLSDPTRYRQLVDSLVYLTTTCHDIAYVVHIVSQFIVAPHSTHYAAVLRIIRYVKGTLFHGLHFSANSSLVLRTYFDANWAGDPSDRRSTTGYCLFLGNSLISWWSKKQAIPSRFSIEAKYKALGDTTSELLSLRWLLEDMGIPQPSSIDLYCDNQSAMQIAHNDVFHERTKHIEVDCHFIRHHVAQKTVYLVFISSTDQPVDFFTKAHFPRRFRTFRSKLKLV